MKIHLFQQCLIDMFYPHVGMAGVEVLERLGCELVVPKKQVCCGQMFTNSGYNDAAMDAIKNDRIFPIQFRHFRQRPHFPVDESYAFTVRHHARNFRISSIGLPRRRA